MNRDILFDYMTGVSIDTGTLIGLYSFNEFSGIYNFNEKYKNPKSLVKNGKVNSDENHLLLLDSGKYFNNITSSGDFTRNTILKISNEIETSGWTVFLNFNYKDNEENLNDGKILLTSMDDPSSTSGFHVGINGASRLYLEHKDKDNIKQTYTLNKELGQSNLVSVSKNVSSQVIELTYYDVANSRSFSESFTTRNLINENGINSLASCDWYIGDFYQPSNGYTGFSGYMGDVLIFDTNLTRDVSDKISQVFFATGFEPSVLNIVEVTGRQVTGVTETTGTITGSGITGYEMVCTSSVSSRDGGSVQLCHLSGVSGALIGNQVTYETGTGIITHSSGVIRDSQIYVNSGEFYSYNKSNIIFEDHLEYNHDNYEIYFYQDFKNNLNKKRKITEGGNYIYLNHNFDNTNLNFYRNGVYVRSGERVKTGILDGEYYVQDDRAYFSGEEIALNNFLYDEIEGTILRTGYDESSANFQTGDSEGNSIAEGKEVLVVFVGDTHDDYDIYLNGHKMMSGIQYEKESTDLFAGYPVYLYKDGLYGVSSGDITFVPRNAGFQRETGRMPYHSEGTSMIFSEQVWRNGIRQIENLNYYKTPQNSLLNTGIRIEKQENLLYNNDNLFFNI